jgi:hypothetical protein
VPNLIWHKLTVAGTASELLKTKMNFKLSQFLNSYLLISTLYLNAPNSLLIDTVILNLFSK